MAKFFIECPHCGTYNQASTSFFARNIIECKCGKLINVSRDKTQVKQCPHCGNSVIYDQSKGDRVKCPVCGEKLITEESKKMFVDITCPSCFAKLTVNKNATSYNCPLCDTKIDVQERIKKEQIKKEGLASVIKFEGKPETIVFKHPIEDFNLGSQLIVHESQEAILFKDGKALDLFGAGRYTLSTNNIPLLSEIYKKPFGDKDIFHSEVYFINLVTQTGIKWGTDSKVRLLEPSSGLYIELGACGEFTLRVSNSRKLLLTLVGTTSEFNVKDVIDADGLPYKTVAGKFKALVVSKVKQTLASVIKENNINILEVDSHIDEISEKLKAVINPTLEDYGLTMPEFYVTVIQTPDDDPNFRRLKQQYAEQYLLVKEERIKKQVAEAERERRLVEAQTKAQEQIIAAQGTSEAYRLQAEAEAKEMQMKGYTYQQETQRQVGLAAMENPGSGNSGTASGITDLAKDIMGVGITLGAVKSVVGMTTDAVTPMANSVTGVVNGTVNAGWECPSCHTKNITSNFCPNCGAKKPEAVTGWECPNCHQKGITSNFCPNCGTKKPSADEGWICPDCGTKNIKTNFCPNCGRKKG